MLLKAHCIYIGMFLFVRVCLSVSPKSFWTFVWSAYPIVYSHLGNVYESEFCCSVLLQSCMSCNLLVNDGQCGRRRMQNSFRFPRGYCSRWSQEPSVGGRPLLKLSLPFVLWLSVKLITSTIFLGFELSAHGKRKLRNVSYGWQHND